MRDLRNDSAISDVFKKTLVEMGPQAVMNFAKLSHEKQQEMQRDWRTSEVWAGKYDSRMKGLGNTGSIDKATRHIRTLGDEIRSLGALTSIEVRVRAARSPTGIPHAASGGFVAQTGLAVIHRGETITPASRGGDGGRYELVLENGERLYAFVRDIASTEAAAQSRTDALIGAMR
jgi:hypothetical protein